MRKILLLVGILVLVVLASPVFAENYTETIVFEEEITAGQSLGWGGTSGIPTTPMNRLNFPAIENYKNLISFEWIETGTNELQPGGHLSGTITAKYEATGTVIGHGYFQYITSEDTIHDRFHIIFTDWDIGSVTGQHYVLLTYSPTDCEPVRTNIQWQSVVSGTSSPTFGRDGGYNVAVPRSLHQTIYSVDYKAEIELSDLGAGGGVYDIVQLYFDRNVDGDDYPSTLDARVNDTIVFADNLYATSGSVTRYIVYYPCNLTVTFGYPSAVYEWKRTLYGDNPTYPVAGTLTPTPTPTATPTPVPELCGYWSLAVNTSNIVRNGYVQGTLTESDPSDRFDKIDWYRVLPSGEEILALSYVYDPGFFGLGAGWFEVSPTGVATASSEAAAKQNTLQFTTSGGAHHLRAKIYDDVSLIPTVYHDYSLVCTLSQVVYVGETIQSTTEQGINVYEADTNALLSSVSLNVYDQNTGEWQNKTSPVGGGTTYFNVVPGHILQVHATKSGWIPFDGSITVSSPPVPYPIYLKRPLVDVVNQSYAHFNVRDSLTREGIYQATIMLSNGQGKKTMPSGYAGFSVNDSETYYYTVTKSGYYSFSDSFSITDDTTFQVLLESTGIPPTTLTYPVSPLPTVTMPTVTPTLVDSDGDGTPDIVDNDDDNDGIPDSSDTDDDDDGIPDNEEVTPTPTTTSDDDDITESERTSARNALKEAYAFVPKIFGFVLLIFFLAIMKRGTR